MANDFRQRCISALTHPLTLTALLTLLLNDHVFKSLLPGDWTTGKLSDLAWVVFSSPLLAFGLSYVSRGNRLAERGAFAVAYVGFPLLYAAFNIFEPLHTFIVGTLLNLTDSSVGSPLDPTDSLVIPVGFAVALWIWRQTPIGTERFRARVYLFAAAIASIATVATSVGEPSPTEWLAGISSEGAVVVEGASYERYMSNDGGLTWGSPIGRSEPLVVDWGGKEVNTPRGTYSIRDTSIVLSVLGAGEREVYSAAYLNDQSNVWAQRYSTRHLRSDLTQLYEDSEHFVTTEPLNLVYDELTGNVVVAMGLQGVLVGTPDETWRRVSVGPFTPTDFSFTSKLRLMLSTEFWLTALGFSLSVLTITLAISEGRDSPDRSASLYLGFGV